MNLAWWLEQAHREHGPKLACVDSDGKEWTYRELHDSSSRYATALRGLGLAEGDVIASLVPECGRHMAIMFAALKLGAIFTAFDPRRLRENLAADVARCRASIVVADLGHEVLGTYIVESVDTPCRLVTLGSGNRTATDLNEAASRAQALTEVTPRTNSEIAALNFTAGTSGRAKGVVFTHGALGTSALGAVFTSGLNSSTVNLSLIGMYHSGGLHDVVKMVIAGGAVVWSGGWDTDRAIRILSERRPNWIFFIVPTMVRDLMRHPDWENVNLRGTGMYVAGEPVPNDVAAALTSKGARFSNAYGMTETMPFRITGPANGIDGYQLAPAGSSGRPRKEFCEVVLKDTLSGEVITDPCVVGEVCVKGDIVAPQYFSEPERTAEAFDAEGYLHTRDLAHFDEAGWFFLSGRVDDVINSGGEKLSLIEVENALTCHEMVRDAACIGVSHDRFGEVPAAFVVTSKEVSDSEVTHILDRYMCDVMERWKRPRLYIFVDAIPRTAAKRSKSLPELRRMIEGNQIRQSEKVRFLVARETRDDAGETTSAARRGDTAAPTSVSTP